MMWRKLTNLQMPTKTIMTDLENKRKALEVQANEVKSNISLEMDDLKKIAKERGNQILIAGGIVAGSYLIYSLFSGGSESKKEEKNEKLTTVFVNVPLHDAYKSESLKYKMDFKKIVNRAMDLFMTSPEARDLFIYHIKMKFTGSGEIK